MNSILQKIVCASAVITTSVVTLVTTNVPEAKAHNHLTKAVATKTHGNKARQTIVETAIGAPSLSTLVGALKAAGLVDALNGKGPLTVFAPDNNAFSKIQVPSDKKTLTKVLTYHVVAGNLTADKLHNGQVLMTLQGRKLKVIKRHGTVKIKSSTGNIVTVKQANIKTSNGVVHIIDNVLLPR